MLINCTWVKKEELGLTSPYAHCPCLGVHLVCSAVLEQTRTWVLGDGNDHPSSFTSPSHQVCWMGQDQDSLGTICRGRRVFSPVTYSSSSANDHSGLSSRTRRDRRRQLLVFCQFMNENKMQKLYDHVQWMNRFECNCEHYFLSQSKLNARNVLVFLYILYF